MSYDPSDYVFSMIIGKYIYYHSISICENLIMVNYICNMIENIKYDYINKNKKEFDKDCYAFYDKCDVPLDIKIILEKLKQEI